MLYQDPSTYDLTWEGGKFKLATDVATEASQRIVSALNTQKGEWDLDTEFGVDYHGIIWVKAIADGVKNAHLQQQILRAAGTGSEIVSFNAQYDGQTRTLAVQCVVKLNDGTIIEVG